ncbi:MAG: hypothetical protein WB682_11010 [Candidatus Dormiibacterota bacterium]
MARLHMREWGSGDRHAVLIHGLSGYSATWTWVVETIPGTGHHVHIDDRPAFMSAILDWMAGSDHAAGG